MKKIFEIFMTVCVAVLLIALTETSFAGGKATARIEPAEMALIFPGILKTPIIITL